MKTIERCVAGGKTYQLVQIFLNDPEAVLLVGTSTERKRIIDAYKIPFEKQNYLMLWNEDVSVKLKGYSQTRKILIDDLDYLLWNMFGCGIHTVSFTNGKLRDYTFKKEETGEKANNVFKIQLQLDF